LDGDAEAHLIALTCSQAPEGHSHWTLRLLADRGGRYLKMTAEEKFDREFDLLREDTEKIAIVGCCLDAPILIFFLLPWRSWRRGGFCKTLSPSLFHFGLYTSSVKKRMGSAGVSLQRGLDPDRRFIKVLQPFL
jgi:hypothetical protein